MKCKELFILGWKNKFPYYSSLLFDEGDNNGGNDGDANNGDNDDTGNNGDAGTNDRNVPKYSDEDIDRIIGDRFKRWEKQHEKKISEAKKLAGLSAEERADELQKRIDELEAEKAHGEMVKTARQLFQNAEITTIPEGLIDVIVASDAETTQKNVKAFIKMFNAAVRNSSG